MIIAAFGPPAAFTQWCLHVLNIMAAVVLERLDYVSVSTIQDFRGALANRQNAHMSFFSDSPDRGLIDAFEKARLPFLGIYEDPEDVTGFLMRDRDMTWMQAVRATNMTFVASGDLLISPLALLVKREERLTIGDFLQRSSAHFGLDVSTDQVDDIVNRAVPGADASLSMEEGILQFIPAAAPIGTHIELTRDERAVIEPLHAAMRVLGEGRAIEQLRWPSELFVGKGGADELLLGPIDMLGPARCLVYGPYLHLPAGLWEVNVVLEVDENFSGNHVDVDIVHGTVLHMESFALPAAGRLALITRFPVSESRESIQIRVIQREGAIEGILRIGDVQVRRIGETALKQAS